MRLYSEFRRTVAAPEGNPNAVPDDCEQCECRNRFKEEDQRPAYKDRYREEKRRMNERASQPPQLPWRVVPDRYSAKARLSENSSENRMERKERWSRAIVKEEEEEELVLQERIMKME